MFRRVDHQGCSKPEHPYFWAMDGDTESREAQSGIDAALIETERAGLRLVLTVRSVVVATLMLFIAGTQGLETGWFGALVASAFLITGLIYRALVVRRRDELWMRFAFVALDFAMLAVIAVTVPLSIHGDVPQIFVFRVYGAGVFYFLLATSALSLSPKLVLWTGAMAIGALWSAWGWIVLQMDRVVTWSAISDERTAEKYIEIVLDPDHVALANRVVETLLLAATAIVTAAAVSRARRMLRDQITAERARGRVAEVFGRFVPREVAETLSQSDGALAAESRVATVLFVDIEGFTSFAEQAEPARIVAVLDAFFDAVSETVTRHRGVPISLIGDAALAAFNAPLENSDHAASAVEAAYDLIAKVARTRFEGEQLTIRIGIATGLVAAGTVGGRARRAYTLYGDTVNLAQRLEAMNKDTGTTLLISRDTWDAAGRPGAFTPIDEVEIRGRAASVAVFAAQSA